MDFFRILKKFNLVWMALLFFSGCVSTHHLHQTMGMSTFYPHENSGEKPFQLPSPYEKKVLVIKLGKAFKKEKHFGKQLQSHCQKAIKRDVFFSHIPVLLDEDEKDIKKKRPSLAFFLTLEKGKISFLQTDWAMGIFSWIFLGLGAQWFHTNLYKFSLQATLEVRDLNKGIKVLKNSYTLEHKDWLNFHERVDGVLPYFYTNVIPPAYLGDSQEALLESLGPPLWKKLIFQIKEDMRKIKFQEKILLTVEKKGSLPDVDVKLVYPKAGETVQEEATNIWLEIYAKKGKRILRKVALSGVGAILDQPRGRPVVDPNNKKITLVQTNVPFQKGRIDIQVQVKKVKNFLSLRLQKKKYQELVVQN